MIFREILVKFVKLDKVRLTEQGWSLFLTELSSDQNDRKVQDVVRNLQSLEVVFNDFKF